MTTGKRPPPSAPGGRRKRPPTTIELEATEVAAAAADGDPKESAPKESAPIESVSREDAPTPDASDRRPAGPDASKATDKATEPAGPDAPASSAVEPGPVPETAAHAGFEPPPPPPRDPPPRRPEEPESPRRGIAWLPEELAWPHVNSAAAGAAGGVLVLFLFWLLGAFGSSVREPAVDLSPRLAAIERQLNELATRPAPPAVDPKAIEDLSARLGRIEALQAAPRAPVTDPVVLGRLNAAENAAKSAADNSAAMSRRADDIETALRDTNARLEALSASLNDLRRTAHAAAVGSDRAVRLAVAASALRAAVDRGEPFVSALATVKPLAPDPGALAPLERFASDGVPSEATLARELVEVLQPMLRSAGEPPRDGGFLERLQANAEKLVRIRRVDEAGGDGRGAILARIEARAQRGNVAGALEELAKLPQDVRAPAEAWIAKAQARNRAVDVSRQFAADAMAALKATP
jgi:hypothetical protein